MMHFELYKDRGEEWRWRLRAANGNIVADSGESYTTKANAEAGIASVKRGAAEAPVREG
ncbi:MAG TPA: HVO_2922 family protein [Kofleriaceae bacterium]|nr:HVO_2922 family protein [Kofleriaceae bacterium]